MVNARAAIAAHRAAYDAFQVAVGDAPSLEAEDAYDAASDALVAAICPSRADAGALLAYLRWWMAEEIEFRKAYEPAYRIAEARATDLAAWLEPAEPTVPDPIFTAIEMVAEAERAHTVALAGLDENDAAQVQSANTAADASSSAFKRASKVMPTTWGGLRALAEFYAREAEANEPFSSGGRYLAHLAAAIAEVRP
ncbi:hypothetical protein HNR00_005089 [Methylorubrum rhodinum]|uniref:Uncharacterized protein n=1 Tax=Methylorubrum rhodinum TaxID=29428 RepID=A0A840ZSM1_9HYPH|nr:hypothetical protein [Methylorubrum rhodinum]MBB5760340.1 hypothetical protein [Methylorubrum rhodinum]